MTHSRVGCGPRALAHSHSALLGLASVLFAAAVAAGCGGGDSASCSADEFVPNYANIVWPLEHWARFPVYVGFARTVAFREELQISAEMGYQEWEAATGGVLDLETAAPEARSEITVEFEDVAVFTLDDGRVAAGLTSLELDGHRIRHASIRLAVANTTPIKLMQIAAHEFGHALGIADGPTQGHSDQPDDLMYPSDTVPAEVSKPVSVRDVNTIKTAYCALF